MTTHEYTNSFEKDWFVRLMELLDGTPNGTVTGAEKRERLGDDYLGALAVMTAENNAYHAGIISKDAKGILRFNREKLDDIVANAERDGGYFIAPCVFDCEGHKK